MKSNSLIASILLTAAVAGIVIGTTDAAPTASPTVGTLEVWPPPPEQVENNDNDSEVNGGSDTDTMESTAVDNGASSTLSPTEEVLPVWPPPQEQAETNDAGVDSTAELLEGETETNGNTTAASPSPTVDVLEVWPPPEEQVTNGETLSGATRSASTVPFFHLLVTATVAGVFLLR